MPMRFANLRTAAGSSAASSTASASNEIAPIGVLSSWLMLATKARRGSPIRRAGEVGESGSGASADLEVDGTDVASAVNTADELQQLRHADPAAPNQAQ